MAITVDPQVVTDAVAQAYDVFAQLGYEFTINVEDVNLNTGDSTFFDTTGLQISHDAIKLAGQFIFTVQDSPSVYVKFIKCTDGTIFRVPDFTQRLRKVEYFDPDSTGVLPPVVIDSKVYSIKSINKIFGVQVLKLTI